MPKIGRVKNSKYDLVIIGAGAAGLRAAMEAERKCLSYVLLEAKSRIGGRAFTENGRLGVPFDCGAYWMHSASMNPFPAIADELGFVYRKGGRQRQVFIDDRWATDEEMREREAYFERNVAAVIQAGRMGKDVPFTDILEKNERWRPLLDQWIAAVNGVDPDRASTLDHSNYRDTGENWPVRDGYGALLARHAANVPVETNTPAERIHWSGSEVRVETPKGTLSAQAAILTVSTGVLASEVIRFEPTLPEWKLSAVYAVPMGMANKVAFAFDRNVFDIPDDMSATVYANSSRTLGFQIRHFGRNVVSGYLGGRLSSEMERAGPRAMTEFALEKLKKIFGSGIVKHLTGTITTAWESDPFIRGAYSAARPGEAHRRAELALPLNGRLFFAGEATSPDFFTTVHGAYFSGSRVVNSVERIIGE